MNKIVKSVGRAALRTPGIRVLALFAQRVVILCQYFSGTLRHAVRWLFTSRENTNFTYDLTNANKDYLAQTVAHVCKVTPLEARAYIAELEHDHELRRHIEDATRESGQSYVAASIVHFGRRLGWYAFVRALKPRVVVETGVDKGLGSCVLTRALQRNAAEGFVGFYYGTDINPKAGYLLGGESAPFGKILFGDSLESLSRLDQKIDLFINDSDHSAAYERREYAMLRDRLSDRAVVLGDNSHVTTELYDFSRETGRIFLFFGERPADHWYPGGGIGISFQSN
jgi:hypothetical protein